MKTSLSQLTVQQLQRALRIKQQIEALEEELGRLLSPNQTEASAQPPRPKRKMSAAVKAKISAAQTARWAQRNKKTAASAPIPSPVKTPSSAKPKTGKKPAARRR